MNEYDRTGQGAVTSWPCIVLYSDRTTNLSLGSELTEANRSVCSTLGPSGSAGWQRPFALRQHLGSSSLAVPEHSRKSGAFMQAGHPETDPISQQ